MYFSERHVVDSLFADVFLGVMIIRGENLALFGEVSGDDPLVEVPLEVVLQRKAELTETTDHHARNVAVDLGFLDDM